MGPSEMKYGDDTLAAFGRFVQQNNPYSLRVFCSETEDEFVAAVEGALNCAVDRLESGRKEYAGLAEVGLSKKISDWLDAASIPATAEEHTNGHVDITVKHPRKLVFKYLGECKIWRSVPYHVKGMKQLLDDYSSGRHRRGCCLEFVVTADCAGKLRVIREHLDAQCPLDQVGTTVDHPEIKGGFVTLHRHSSGWDVEVLHFGCNLHNPA